MNNVLLIGVMLLLALVGGHLVKRIKIPEVVGYLLIGLLLGPSFAKILTHEAISALEIFGQIALGLILFSMGAVFEFENLKNVGKRILYLTSFIMAGSFVAVFATMYFFSSDWRAAVLLGVIASEVSPIATILVLRELNSEGPVSETVYNIVGLNNVCCLILFGLVTFLIRITQPFAQDVPFFDFLTQQSFALFWEIIGSISLGIALGYLLAFWGKNIDEHGEILILVLGVLLLTVGVCHWLGLSSLIATMALGATLINLVKESRHLFSVLGKTDPPLYAIFFVLAGAELKLASLKLIGVAGVAYTIARIIGKIGGAYGGSKLFNYPPVVAKYLGTTLIPHAGVAIGLVLQTRSVFPDYSEFISGVILASVFLNEILGPILTKYSISRAGEVRIEKIGAFQEL